VLDTDVLVAAFRSERGASRQLLITALDERPVLTDAEDEHVLDLAMNGRADMLVTFDQDDFTEASKTFQMEVVTPAVALRQLR
jgi:predicted nucleic acid-binding protein